MIITRVFLFNYVVAVLTSIYQFMIVEGEYTYSKMRYLFYKKYQKLYVSDKNFIAQLTHKKEHYYSEIVIHPPPLNLIVAFISLASLPVLWNKDIRLKVLKFSGLVIFWFENILFLIFFLTFELACAFGAYVKLSIIFGTKIAQKRKALYFFIIWIFSGLLICFGLSFRDSYFLFKVFQVIDTDSRVVKAKQKK